MSEQEGKTFGEIIDAALGKAQGGVTPKAGTFFEQDGQRFIVGATADGVVKVPNAGGRPYRIAFTESMNPSGFANLIHKFSAANGGPAILIATTTPTTRLSEWAQGFYAAGGLTAVMPENPGERGEPGVCLWSGLDLFREFIEPDLSVTGICDRTIGDIVNRIAEAINTRDYEARDYVVPAYAVAEAASGVPPVLLVPSDASKALDPATAAYEHVRMRAAVGTGGVIDYGVDGAQDIKSISASQRAWTRQFIDKGGLTGLANEYADKASRNSLYFSMRDVAEVGREKGDTRTAEIMELHRRIRAYSAIQHGADTGRDPYEGAPGLAALVTVLRTFFEKHGTARLNIPDERFASMTNILRKGAISGSGLEASDALYRSKTDGSRWLADDLSATTAAVTLWAFLAVSGRIKPQDLLDYYQGLSTVTGGTIDGVGPLARPGCKWLAVQEAVADFQVMQP